MVDRSAKYKKIVKAYKHEMIVYQCDIADLMMEVDFDLDIITIKQKRIDFLEYLIEKYEQLLYKYYDISINTMK